MRRLRGFYLGTTLFVAACAPPQSTVSPPAPLDTPSSSAPTAAAVELPARSVVEASVEASLIATAPAHPVPDRAAVSRGAVDASPVASGPARAGEVCATYSTFQPVAGTHRPCAAGLVCCVPPHGAVMQVETAVCMVPCKPTPPSGQPQVAGCSANGCPWALVP
jgi:hypothetical protein